MNCWLSRRGEHTRKQQEAIGRLLNIADLEFVPPLSVRQDTMALAAENSGDLGRYIASMASEDWLVAMDDATTAGFLSFATLADPFAFYVTTIVVDPCRRRSGIGRSLYEALGEEATRRSVPWLTTRTWSTNVFHLRLLDSLGFERTGTITDDRGPGIDTVQLARST